MKKNVLFVLLFIVQFLSIHAQSQYEIEGVIVPRTIEFQNQKLQLNGFGSRSKMWVEVYVQALYLTQLSQNPKDILDSDLATAIRIEITSSLVSSKKLSKSINKGMMKSVGEGGMKKFNSELNLLEKLLTSENIKRGDAFNLIYNPADISLWIFKNDKLQGKIPGFDFKKAFFGIWLSDNPVDEDLKKSLLGID